MKKMKMLVMIVILVFFTNIIMANEVNVNLTNETEEALVLENWMFSNWDLDIESILIVEPWMMDRRVWKTDTMNHRKFDNKNDKEYQMTMRDHQSGEMKHQRGRYEGMKQGATYHGMKQGMKHKGNREYAMRGDIKHTKVTPEMLRERAAKMNKMAEMMIKKAEMMEKKH